MPRSLAQILRSRAIVARISGLIGVAWLAFGVSVLGNSARVPLAIIGVVIAAGLLQRARRLLAASHLMPTADAAQNQRQRVVWIKFWINLVFVFVLLNVALNLLAAPALHLYWASAISFVFGLHLAPMARFMAIPSYGYCSVAVMLGAVATAAAIRVDVATPTLLISLESIFNALVLWASAAWSVRSLGAIDNASVND